MSENVRCYRVHIKTPHSIQQWAEPTWAGLAEKDYVEKLTEEWEQFGKRHNVKVELDIKEIPCSEMKDVRVFFKKRGVK